MHGFTVHNISISCTHEKEAKTSGVLGCYATKENTQANTHPYARLSINFRMAH